MAVHRAIATTEKGILGQVKIPTKIPDAEEVQIQVDSSVLSTFDTYQIDRAFCVSAYPNVIGIGGGGIVKAVGKDVKHLKTGDRVALLGYGGNDVRSLQEIATLSYTQVGKIPQSLSFEAAATMPDSFVTAWFTLVSSLGLPLSLTSPPTNPTEPILIFGSGSSVGQFMIQVLKATGFTQVLATASPKHDEYLRQLGAAHVFDYNSSTLVKDITAAIGGSKLKFAVNCVATTSSFKLISEVVEAGSRVAFLTPVKRGSSILNTELYLSIPEGESPFGAGVEVVPTTAFDYPGHGNLKEDLMPKILPALLEKKSLQANRINLFDSGTLQERAEKARESLKTGAGGLRVIVKVAGAA